MGKVKRAKDGEVNGQRGKGCQQEARRWLTDIWKKDRESWSHLDSRYVRHVDRGFVHVQ